MIVQELVELVLRDLEETGVGADEQRTCLEVGCGSGAISLSLLNSLPQVRFVFTVWSQFVSSSPYKSNMLCCACLSVSFGAIGEFLIVAFVCLFLA